MGRCGYGLRWFWGDGMRGRGEKRVSSAAYHLIFSAI